MTKFEINDSANYAAAVVRVPEPFALPNADRLVGLGIQGFTVITAKDGNIREGDLAVFFPAEAQLSERLARGANLHRHGDLNADQSQRGYLEDNRRVRALKLRGTVSNGLLLPVAEVARIFGISVGELSEGLSFDTIDGAEVSRKYRVKEPVSRTAREDKKLKKAFKRITNESFPIHIETDQWGRNEQFVDDDEILIVSQKLHGTSFRAGRVPVLRQPKWHEKVLRKLGVKVAESEVDVVYGSRQVVKDIHNPNQQHWYGTDLWSQYGESIADRIPANVIVYGELVGWTTEGTPIQKGHTYRVEQGEAELYVYRVALITSAGDLWDLSWDQVRVFCGEHGLKHVPELWRGFKSDFDASFFSEKHFAAEGEWVDRPVPLSADGTGADEGIAIRVERGARVPALFKIKNQSHFLYETAQLDAGEVDLESQEAA